MNNYLLDIVSIGAIVSSIFVITSKNPVVSVLFLISVFVQVAGYLCLLGIGFIGITYLIIYVGAIAILFLFVIIILNLQLQELTIVGKEYTKNLPLVQIIGSLFLYIIVQIVPFSYKDQNSFNLQTQIKNIYNVINNIIQYIVNYINQKLFDNTINTINNNIHITYNSMQADQYFENYIQIQSIGQLLYTNGIIWLIICSIILLLSIVGPITISINKNK